MFLTQAHQKFAIVAAAVFAAAFALPHPAAAQQQPGIGTNLQYVLCIQNVAGPGAGPGFPGCIEVSALGLSVGRQMKDSGEKGGTEALNIGIGNISAIAIRKPTDGTSALLFSYAINGNTMGDAELYVLEQRDGWSQPLPTLEVQLERSFVQSLQLDAAAPVENLEIYFNKIQLTSYERDASGAAVLWSAECWDKVSSTSCSK